MLRRECGEPKPEPELKDGQLPLASIRYAISVFQPRLGDKGPCE
jgi:hypothetical protein